MFDDGPKKRLPRQRRVDEASRPPMILTDRDCEIIRFVNDCRALRADQIERQFFNSRSTTQYRLAKLFHHEYLDRQFLSIASSAPASNPAVYVIGKRGMQILVDRFHYERSDLRPPKSGSLGWHLLEHLLKVNDIRITMLKAAGKANFSIDEWIDETAFRSHPDYVHVPDQQGRAKKYPIFPDGYFSLNTSHGKARFFLEVDRGTETISKFVPQIRAYDTYVASGGYQARFQAKSLRVLIVTSSEKRLQSLMRVTEEERGDQKYCFTTFDQITEDTALRGQIWRRLGIEKNVPLFS